MDGLCDGGGASCAYRRLLAALSLIPTAHYLCALPIASAVFLYHFLEFHFIEDVLTGLRGSPVKLTYNPLSQVYEDVVSKCCLLHGRYLATPWLSSPHLQTAFLQFFGRPPSFTYTREIFNASDGCCIALDWLTHSCGCANTTNKFISKEDSTPIVVVIPGMMSDSSDAYIKHLVFHMAKKRRWNVVVINHRGQCGISLTTDCFYNAGWTEDLRAVVNHLSREHPAAPLYIAGTSIGANVLVKYLAEEGEDVPPVAGAVAVCSPWDLLIGDRFICRKLVQTMYDRAIASGLQSYAFLHETWFSRLANWEGLKRSRSIRDFNQHATCPIGKFETVDSYYRHCSSANYIGNVSVPLLCISALDDPVCTKEAIPWDECRLNKNVVLATTKHGGHLGFFEGLAGSSLWWVRAADEFLHNLDGSQYLFPPKKVHEADKSPGSHTVSESSIDQGPYVNVSNGMVAPICRENDLAEEDTSINSLKSPRESDGGSSALKERKSAAMSHLEQESGAGGAVSPFRRCLDLIVKESRRPVWLLAHIAIVVTWPMVGSALRVLLARQFRKALPAPPVKR